MGGELMSRTAGSVVGLEDGRLRVALLSFEFAEICVALANGLSSYAEVCLLLPDDQAAELGVEVSPAVRLIPFHKPRLRQALRQWQLCRKIVNDVEQFRPHVVHVQQGHLWLNIFALASLRRHHPLVLTIHDPSPHVGDRPSARTPQWVMNHGFRLASQVVVHTEVVRARVVRELGWQTSEVHVVPHVAVPPGPPSETGGGNQSAAHPVVLFFGRIWPYKGLEYLVRAEERISAVYPDVEIVIAGGGEDLDRYRRAMVHPERFTVRDGFISRSERAQLFDKAWVVVLPYIDATQSGVIPMAFASGRTVVATTVGGLSEMVDDGVTGMLVPPANENALADAIIALLRDAGWRGRLAEAGHRKAMTEWAPHPVARQTLAVYERTLARATRPA